MVISNWVEKKLEDRRIRREQTLIEQGRKQGLEEGFEQGRTYERERIEAETNGQATDDTRRGNGR